MSFGSTPDTILFELLFGFGALAAIALLALVGRFVGWILRIRSGWFTLLFVVFGIVGTALGLSLYLDQMGSIAQATITKKQESIRFREEGDWRHHYEIWASYALADGAQPIAHFATDANRFDKVREGSAVAVRSVSINGWFNLVRFADQSTWTWIPWDWLAIGLAVGMTGYLGWQLLKVRGGWVLVALVLLALMTVPFWNKYQEWRAANDERRTPLQGQGVIDEVHEVMTIDPLPGDSSDGDEWETEMTVAQRYAIVVVRYTPQGYGEPILGVDAVDLPAVNLPEGDLPLHAGDTVDLAYGLDDLRTVRLPGYTREHYIRNPLAWLREQLFLIAFAAGLSLLVSWVGRRLQRFLTAGRSEVYSRN